MSARGLSCPHLNSDTTDSAVSTKGGHQGLSMQGVALGKHPGTGVIPESTFQKILSAAETRQPLDTGSGRQRGAARVRGSPWGAECSRAPRSRGFSPSRHTRDLLQAGPPQRRLACRIACVPHV